MQLLERIEQNMTNLTPIGDDMQLLKTQNYDEERANQLKEKMKKKLSPEIIDIVLFLISKEAKPIQDLAMSLFRDKLKTYQNELTVRCFSIYELRDNFSKIKVEKDAN
jgi:hypothetical protein